MSVFTVDRPAAPDPDPLDEAHPRLRPTEFPTAVDPALRGRCPATPADVHIRQRRAA